MILRPGLVLAPLCMSFLATSAHAQAPGEVVPQAAAPVGCEAPGGEESVMARRWAVGLSVGSMSLAPEGQSNETMFAMGELALRLRATPHLELALMVGGGRERTAQNQDGDLEVTQGLLAARYRFRPEAAWNFFVTGGLGGASVARHDATRAERDRATQPVAMLGVGVERRFAGLALQAELRAVGLGERKADAQNASAPVPVLLDGSAPPPPPMQAVGKQSGGSLTVGLSYYF